MVYLHPFTILVGDAGSASEACLQHWVDQIELVQLLRGPGKKRNSSAIGILRFFVKLFENAGRDAKSLELIGNKKSHWTSAHDYNVVFGDFRRHSRKFIFRASTSSKFAGCLLFFGLALQSNEFK